MTVAWQGWDGSTWDLTEQSGVVLGSGARGFGLPEVDLYESVAAGVDGSRHRGHRVVEREVFLPLWVFSEAGQAWFDLDRSFAATLRPDAPGLLTVVQPSGEARTLTCRLLSGGDEALDLDPGLLGWAATSVVLRSNDPYWSGAPVSRSWGATAPVDFIQTSAPPFHISPSNTLASASVTNPGDVDAWPVWTITGPVTSVDLGVGSRLVEVPAGVADGDVLTIDTRPTAQTATLQDGTNEVPNLGAWDPAPIPPGESVSLSIDMVGAGSVAVAFTPRYYRAW